MDQTEVQHHQRFPRIRTIDASHIGNLIRIAESANLSHWSAQSYLEELKNPASVMLRLESDANSTIGFIVGRTISAGVDSSTTDAEIYNVAVVESEQQKGYGQLLLDSFVGNCQDRGVVHVWLEVRESNQKAIRFYERSGFIRVQTRNHFYNDPREHALLMKLVLEHQTA